MASYPTRYTLDFATTQRLGRGVEWKEVLESYVIMPMKLLNPRGGTNAERFELWKQMGKFVASCTPPADNGDEPRLVTGEEEVDPSIVQASDLSATFKGVKSRYDLAVLEVCAYRLKCMILKSVSSGNGEKRKEEDKLPAAKRRKKSVEDDLICPITLDLPLDPVTAEDGQVYERGAIQQYFDSKPDEEMVKSPMISEMMRKNLFPAPRHRNTIETLIEDGVISGPLADKWNAKKKEKAQEKQKMKELVTKAENGDTALMVKVANSYCLGKRGFKQDYKKAYEWYKKAHVAGDALGTSTMGEFELKGLGVPQDTKKGIYLLGLAVGKEVRAAAYLMGLALACGMYGFDADVDEAQRLLELSLTKDPRGEGWCLSKATRKKAQTLVDALHRQG